MSSMRSTSSSTRTLTSRSVRSRCSRRSSSRPGVATTTSTPRLQVLALPAVAHAAVDHGRAQVGELAKVAERLLDLQRQLARGLEDEAAQRPVPAEALQDRQGEGGRLAGAGLGGADDVAAGEHERDGLHLDGRGLGVAHLLHGVGERVGEPKLGEHIVHRRHRVRRDMRRRRRRCRRAVRRHMCGRRVVRHRVDGP